MRPLILRIIFIFGLIIIPQGLPLAADTAPTPGGDLVSLSFQDVKIRTVISTVSKLTGRNFVVDPSVRGKVTVIAAQPIPRDEIYPLFLSLLKVYNLAAVEGDQVTQIIPMDKARASGQPLAVGESDPADEFVTRLIRLEFIQADRLISVLRPLVPPKAYLAAASDSNMLIISDRAANTRRLAAIVAELDQARSGDIEILPLKYADAADLARVVQNLDTGGRKKGDLRVIADERTNSLLLAGRDFQLLQIKAIVKNLDTPVKEEGATQVIYLRYARAVDLVKVLAEVPVADKSATPSSLRKKLGGADRKRVSIVADENTNSLVITAPPAVMRDLRQVIRRLDIRRPQVLIEAIIAEVSTGASFDLGVQWRSTDITSSDQEGLIGGTSFSSATSPGINAISADPLNTITGMGSLSGLSLGYIRGSADILGTKVLNMAALLSAL